MVPRCSKREVEFVLYLSKAVEGIEAVAEEFQLTLDEDDIEELKNTGGHLPIYRRDLAINKSLKVRTGDSPRFGSGGAVATLTKKETDVRMMWTFFAIIGDYESMLMLLPTCPTPICPSMNQDSVFLFANFLCRQRKDNPHSQWNVLTSP